MTTGRSEDARAFFQERLAQMYRVGFALSLAFLTGIIIIRGIVGAGPLAEIRSPSRWFHMIATVLMGALWAAVARSRLRFEMLELVDAIGVLGLSVLLNLNAGLFEIRTVAVFNLILTTGLIMVLRAVIVPSTALRTLTLGLLAGTGTTAIFLISGHPAWPVKQLAPPDWSLPYQAISLVLWLGTLVATATVTSRLIYDLRREVRKARKLGQYVIGEKIGEGGMGTVYRATHAMLRRETALKLLPPNRIDAASLRRFEREVVATARLRHPNTVQIYDYGRTLDGTFYYAMEYLDGITIAELVEQEGPLPAGRVVSLLAQVCASLEEAHALGLVHRDVKPENIMIVGHAAAYDLVKVLDFGLVKSIAAAGEPSLTNADAVIGTPHYLAPECINNPDVVDARSDIYALAAVGFFMMTGEHVFEEKSLIEICAAHLHREPPSLRERLGSDVPADLDALLLRGLAKSPKGRPKSARAFHDALVGCAVEPWTSEDARRWWRTRARSALPSTTHAAGMAYAPTISVMLEPRSADSL